MLHVYEMDETPPQNKGDQHDQPDAFQFWMSLPSIFQSITDGVYQPLILPMDIIHHRTTIGLPHGIQKIDCT